MHNYSFEKLRKLFISKQPDLLKAETTRLIEFLFNDKYLHGKTFYHPLGFIYSKLFEFPNKETIRIHIWNSTYYAEKPVMDTHTHYYIVNSFIYRGCIHNFSYKVDEAGENNFALFEGAYTDAGDRILKKTDKQISLALNRTDIYCQGTLYQVAHDEIHSGHPAHNTPVCTVVYTEKPRDPSPLVLGPMNGNLEYFHPNNLVESTIIDLVLQDIIDNNV